MLRFLRRFGTLPDHTDQVFVVDRQGRFRGALSVSSILTHSPTDAVSDLMTSDILTLNPLDEARDAAQAFERYDLVSAPVVDEAGRLVGRLTVNEVVDIIRERSDEEAYTAVGLDEDQDIFGNVWEVARSRWLWLGVNLCTAFFASRVISAFDGTIERVVALAALMRREGLRGELSLDEIMCCGVGSCFGCVVKVNASELPEKFRYARSCVEGPVFPAEEIYLGEETK